jgi:hypothetical protein
MLVVSVTGIEASGNIKTRGEEHRVKSVLPTSIKNR